MSEAGATLIEGIGDEVLLFASISLTLVAGLLVVIYIQSVFRPRSGAQDQSTRQDVNSAQNGSARVMAAAPYGDCASPRQTELAPGDSEAVESATSDSSSSRDHGEDSRPLQQECGERGTEEEALSPDVVRQRRLEFIERNACVESISGVEPVEPDSGEDSAHSADEAAPAAREEEGFAIRLKYLNDTERCVRGRPDETVASFKRRHFAAELAGQRLVRLIYNGGQLRDDNARLSSCGLSDGCVVHVHISTAPVVQNETSSANSNGEGDLNLGALMWPLFAATLGILWVLHFQYRELFNTSSTVVLVGISGLFCVGLYGQHYPQSPATADQGGGTRNTPLSGR
uniref:Protein containing ubiquitin domain n=1 Tax=Rhipicephalus zambeziensis TaxID=60191 RepID=A0A224YV83_9ACAR